MSADIAIVAQSLRKSFGALVAVDDINLTVASGSIFALLGPNGAGKTTVVRMLATLIRPTLGTARIFGYDVVRDATAVRSMIGLTGQYASIDENLSAEENLRIFGRLLGLSRQQAGRRAAELLEQFELSGAADRPAATLSGGTRRRLDLAATLITYPPLIFLDEPTTGLDPHNRVQMWATVRSLAAAGVTILLTTQYLEEADMLADRIAVIDHGSVIAEGSADELKRSVGGEVLRVELAETSRLSTAVTIAERLSGHTAGVMPDHSALSIPLSDIHSATKILVELQRGGIALRGFGVDRPDLNEVFLALTGRIERQDVAS
ncbi:ATP-binding cassette domain-containing protein [Nocardia terpenica]|uniref:Daunorubicin/doxorubicin resistance ABC transporter ATP-binding protein DrrA n=1 Tax=Nocardia terpenica TaxID=455432 RepID=A0A291RNV1_9NOCA|nr:ATP-binding cassette domain-containing protein [Nocardia terpenica]ATL69243.1 daunorubicin/doxorubicin resistance ABC transporter ATP-binding protein DrrA [Nocardia terpenica]